jgi:nucleoside 2-deoxyribosyltransferase
MAGPLFSTAECAFNDELARHLRMHGHEVFLPQENEQGTDATKIFLSDKAGVDWCQLVLGNLDGPDPDSGTCWELGYGYGTNKAIMCFRTDFRVFTGVDKCNLMMTESANLMLYMPKASISELAEKIDNEIRYRFEPTRHKPLRAEWDPMREIDAQRSVWDTLDDFDQGHHPFTPIYRHADK